MMAESSSDNERAELNKGRGCLTLFALPFALVGVLVGGWLGYDVWRWYDAQSWIATPAVLRDVELVTTHDEGTSYRATATYDYALDGGEFTGHGVAIHSGSDNIGRYQQRRARELEQALAAGGDIVCYVNPRDPSDALLFRDLRLEMVAFKAVFALIFGGVGFGLIIGAWYGAKIGRRRLKLKEQLPDEPWRWRDDWRTGRIRSSLGKGAVAMGVFAAVWNLISWPAIYFATTSEDAEWWAIAIAALFPAVGALLAVWAGRLALLHVRWGRSEFEMAAVPGVLGGSLAGVIHAPGGINPTDGFHLRLACIRTVHRQRGGETTTEEVTVWERYKTIVRDLADRDPSRTMIPVQFTISYDLPASGDNVAWKLEASAARPGVDFRTEFELPVFKTDASSPTPPAEPEDALAAYEAPTDFAGLMRRIGAIVDEALPDRRRLRFPIARNRAMSAFLTLFTIGWIGVCVGLFYSAAPRFFPWGFSGFGALLVIGVVTTVFHSTVLEYNARGVAFTHRYLGFGKRRDVSRDIIDRIVVTKSGTTYNGRPYRSVKVQTASSLQQTLAADIAREQDAEQLAADIRRVLGLDASQGQLRLDADLPGELSMN